MGNIESNSMSELDYLYCYEAAAKASVAACAATAAQAYAPALRMACLRQCETALEFQHRARVLIARLGGAT